jgi:hypothetical protein
MVGLAPGEDRERNLTWLDWSFPDNTSADGKTVLFDEQDRPRPEYLSYVRKTDGSPRRAPREGQGTRSLVRRKVGADDECHRRSAHAGSHGRGRLTDAAEANLVYQWASSTRTASGSWSGRTSRGGPRECTCRGSTSLARGRSPARGSACRSAEARRSARTAGPSCFAGATAACTSPRSTAAPRRRCCGRAARGGPPGQDGGRRIRLRRDGSGYARRIEICDVATGARRLWKGDSCRPIQAGVSRIGPIYIAPDGKSYVYSYGEAREPYLVTG